MARVVFISMLDSAPWGGSEELWSRTALRLHESGDAVGAGVSLWPQPAAQVRAMQARGIEMHYQRRPGGSIWDKLRKRAAKNYQWNWLRAFAPDLVVFSLGGVPDSREGLHFCRKAGLPYVVVLHANTEGWWLDDDSIDDLRQVLAEARKVFCVSQHNLSLLRKQLGTELPQAEVVWNPNNLDQIALAPWPATEHGYRIACVGRLEPGSKGQDILFECLANPKWRERPIELNVYGTGRGERSLRSLAGYLRLEKVHFRGHVSNINAIWADNHLLVLPSRVEGLPLTLVEAMLCGRPAIVTDVGGNAEVCLDGETGFVAPAPTRNLLDETMERAWQQRDRWKEMGERANKRVQQLVPRDPVEIFCDKLRTLTAA